MKEKLAIEEDILVEKVHCTRKILRNGEKRIKKKTIFRKFVNFNDRSATEGKIFVNEDFFEETTSIGLWIVRENKRS